MAGAGIRAGLGAKPRSGKAVSEAVSAKAAESTRSIAPTVAAAPAAPTPAAKTTRTKAAKFTAPAYGQGSMWQHFGPTEAEAAKTILAAARTVEGEGNWHGKKIFIGALYDQLHGSTKMPKDTFKAGLVELHQKGLIRLSRADLVEAMPRRMVLGSETAHQNATFHFVRIDGGG